VTHYYSAAADVEDGHGVEELGDGEDEAVLEGNENSDSECEFVSHTPKPQPLITLDFVGDDEHVAENSCTAERMQKKHARQSKKKQMSKELKMIQKQSKQSKREAAKAQKSQSKSDAAKAKKSRQQQAKPAKSDAAAAKKFRPKSTKVKSPSALELPEVHEAAEQSESMSSQKKLQKHQRQKQQQQERTAKYDAMVDNTAQWIHDVYRKDTGTERGLGVFASRRIEIGKPTAK
jgi:phage-related minor tail protein